MSSDGETEADAAATARFVIRHAELRHGSRWLGGLRRPPLHSRCDNPSVRVFAERLVFQMKDAVPKAIVGWAAGSHRVVLLDHRPTASDVLRLQARGWRCVSLLADGHDTAPHADALDFAIHDLCHLEKFAAPDHHVAQVGFFALLDRAMADPRWAELEAPLDADWPPDRDRVAADMNGHAAYLFVALKRKLWLAWERSRPGDTIGARVALGILFDLLALAGPARDVANTIGARGNLPAGLAVLVDHFRTRGEAALAR